MPTLRELAAESIGRITRRGLEPQLAQVEAKLEAGEPIGAVAHGLDGSAGVLVVVTGTRVLLSRGEPFAKPALTELAVSSLTASAAVPQDDAWALQIEHTEGHELIPGMVDRDAQRLAVLLDSAASG